MIKKEFLLKNLSAFVYTSNTNVDVRALNLVSTRRENTALLSSQ